MSSTVQPKSARLLSVHGVDLSLAAQLKSDLFTMFNSIYTNTIVSMKIDNLTTVQRMTFSHSPAARLHKYSIVQLVVYQCRVASDDISDKTIEQYAKSVIRGLRLPLKNNNNHEDDDNNNNNHEEDDDNNNNNINNDGYDKARDALIEKISVLDPQSLSTKQMHETIYMLTRYDKDSLIENCSDWVLHENTKIYHFAKVSLCDYLTALNAGSPQASDLDYYKIDTRNNFFQDFMISQRPRVYSEFLDEIKQLHRLRVSLSPYLTIHGGWPDECAQIFNMWEESMRSPRGPTHKQPHLLIYGPANMGKTRFVTEALFGGLHKTVSCLFVINKLYETPRLHLIRCN
jgi:hypothetical protein